MVEVTLLRSVEALANLVTAPVDTLFDLTDAGAEHLERCLACWPHAHVHTVQPGSPSPRVTRITGPRFAATPNWGAAPAPRHGVLADLARRQAATSSASARPAVAMTLDDYVQLEGIGPISLLLLSATLPAVDALLGASQLLAGGGIHAVALLAPAPGPADEEALLLLTGVLGKFEVEWARLDAQPVSLAVRQAPAPGRPRSWDQLASALDLGVTGVIRVGIDEAAGLSARDGAGSGPLFLIDANLPALERRRQELGNARDVTCIGPAISDIEVTTCTLDALAEKYELAAANVLTLDLAGGKLAALRGATQVLRHIDLLTLSIADAPQSTAERNAIDLFMSRHGFFAVSLPRTAHDSPQVLVYVRKERLWAADPVSVIRRVMQTANVSLQSVGWHGAAAAAALRASPSLPEQVAFADLQLTAIRNYSQATGLGAIDVLVSSDAGLPAFQALLEAALHSSRLCAIVLLASLSTPNVEAFTRVAFDHGFLLDRDSAISTARVFLRSSSIREPARWLAINNAYGRRDFRYSALGQMGRFGNQLFQIMHLLLSSLRHNARASTCPWPFNDYFRLDFLEGTGEPGTTWEVAPGMWPIMAVWAFEELPDAVDYRAHLQWLAPFLSRHAAFMSRCFDLQPKWALRAGQMLETLKAGAPTLTAFHVRRTDYLLSEVLDNPWHQEIPMSWYGQALESRQDSTIFAASDDLDYVEQALPGLTLTTHRTLSDCGLPPLLIDHCVMRAADTLLMVNSTFSRTAGLFSTGTQTALLPNVGKGMFAPYSPWHDPVYWSRFDDRYFIDFDQHQVTVEGWLAAVGVPQLLAHEKRGPADILASSQALATSVNGKVLLRTHFIDSEVVAFAQRIRSESGYEVLFVVDENAGPLPVPPQFRKVSVTDANIRAAGLFATPDSAWRCGDYGFYLARPQLEGAHFVWMIEYGVALAIGDLREFFARFDRAHHQDFLAPYFGEGDPAWSWHPLMRRFVPAVYGCLFPVTRLTLPLIDYLVAQRRALATTEDWNTHPDDYPNDESFTASMAVAGGFACAALTDCWPGVHTPKTFPQNGLPIPYEFALAGRTPGVIFHPVYHGARFMEKLSEYRQNANPDDLVSAALLAEYLRALADDRGDPVA